MSNEIVKVQERYERRKQLPSLYDPLRPSVYLSQQEKERALIHWIKSVGIEPVNEKRLLEIGCGTGANLLQFIRLGFLPEHLVGNELLDERVLAARHRLPRAVQIIAGDASELAANEGSFDIVFQSLVFTSVLDDEFQSKLAKRMWSLVKPGGGILWYDFTYNNPKNPDVRGVPVKRISELFPEGDIKSRRLTLAPPLSRLADKTHPSFYTILNVVPFLRTHTLCWIRK